MTVTRHPNYINWAYYFAMLMAGGERYWRKGKKGLLVTAVFLNLLTSYYTFFMNALMFAVYTALRAICRWSGDRTAARAKAELVNCLKTAGVCLAGALLSMVVLMPTLYAYSNNARFNVVSGAMQDEWHYPLTYYPRLVVCLFAAYMTPSYYTHIGLNALVFPALVLLAMNPGRFRRTKAGLLACAVGLALPIIGRFLNGMGYVCNRWSYALAFAGSAAMVRTLPMSGLPPAPSPRVSLAPIWILLRPVTGELASACGRLRGAEPGPARVAAAARVPGWMWELPGRRC